MDRIVRSGVYKDGSDLYFLWCNHCGGAACAGDEG